MSTVPKNNSRAVPHGYVKVENPAQLCRCLRLIRIGTDAYCCNARDRMTDTNETAAADRQPAEIPPIVPGLSQEEVAQGLKEILGDKLADVCVVMTEIRRAGFVPQFQLGLDAAQRDVVMSVHLVKYF